jgi:hypothetical protein
LLSSLWPSLTGVCLYGACACPENKKERPAQHSVRFLQKAQSQGGQAKNPAPGVCVDIRSDVAPGGVGSEFFLNPSPCSLSTCKPVRYIIVQNKRADDHEDFPERPPVRIRDFKQCELARLQSCLCSSGSAARAVPSCGRNPHHGVSEECAVAAVYVVTYAMCWMYPNWPAPVKVPFVVQCAGKLAKLMEDVKKESKGPVEVHDDLLTGFYYL